MNERIRTAGLAMVLVAAGCADDRGPGMAAQSDAGHEEGAGGGSGAGPERDAAIDSDAATETDAGVRVVDPPTGPPLLCRLELSCPQAIPDEPKIDCAFNVFDGEGASVYEGQAGVEQRGRSSQSYPKRNYAVELRDATGAEQPTNLLGMGAESDWVLDGSWVDRSFVRNDLAFTLYRNLVPGVRWAPRARFCELTLNGAAQGIYRLGERIKRDDDRVDLPDDPGDGTSILLKQDTDGVIDWDVGEGSRFELLYPKQDTATNAQLAGAQTFLDALDAALSNPDPSVPAQNPLTLLDLDAVVDFMLVQELAKSADAYNLSLHLFKPANALGELVPWDFDLSMGQPISSIRPGNELPSLWVRHRTLLSDGLEALPLVRARLAERWHMHRAGPLSDAAVMEELEYLLATLTPEALEANFALWPIDDVDFSFIYAPYTLPEATSHPQEVQRLKQWLLDRLAWIDANIDAYPAE